MTDQHILFICGLHRSGTSVLHALLRKQEFVSGFENTGVSKDEGQLLPTVFPPARDYGGPGKFGFHPAAAMTEHHPLCTAQHREKLFKEWSSYWQMDKRILIEKSPPNIIRMRFLQAMFPEARFITIVRHPVAVAYATQKWSHTSLRSLIQHWLTVHEIHRNDIPYLRRHHHVSYEALTGNPAEVLRGIEQYLGIDIQYDHELINQNERYFARWMADGALWRMRRWMVIQEFQDRCMQFGYSLKDLTKYPFAHSATHLESTH